MPIELTDPTTALHREWIDYLDEWAGAHIPGSGLRLARSRQADLHDPVDFAWWIDELNSLRRTPPESAVPATSWWIARDEAIVGTIQLRHELDRDLAELGGHIGYGVRPSARRQGVAHTALRSVLRSAAALGISDVLVTCDDDNLGSRRTAESVGGTLRRIRPVDDYARGHDHPKPLCHYWISTSQ